MIQGANTTVTTYRLSDSGSTSSFSATPTLSGVEAYIEHVTSEISAVLGEQPGLERCVMYIEPANIRPGDKVVDAQSNEYRVTGIERHENNLDTDDVYIVQLNKKVVDYNG